MKNSRFYKTKNIVIKGIILCLVLVYFSAGSHFASAAGTGSVILNIDSTYDSTGRASVSATLVQTGRSAYFYIEDNWWSSLPLSQQNTALSAINNLSNEFDQNIYPNMTSVYGSEWKPGIDNDSRITILITKMVDEAGGYFNYTDEYSKTQFASSNEKEMLYLNSTYLTSSRVNAFVAHEFQHLITFYQKNIINHVDDDTWLNEARSEYAATLLGYDNNYPGSNLEKRVGTFLSQPSNSLTEWKNDTSDYGVANLFMQYLVEHYGTRILTLTIQSPFIGVASIDSALQILGINKTFADVFTDWSLANYLNNCSANPADAFCYLNSSIAYNILHISPTATYNMGQGYLELATWIKDWSPRWYKIDAYGIQPKILQVNFEGFGATSGFKIPYILDDNGILKVYSMNVGPDQKSNLLIPNFGSQIRSIILIPINTFKKTNFTTSDPNTPFSFKLLTQEGQAVVYPDGSLLKAADDQRVYLIDSGMRRWISSSEIFNSRGLRWENIKIISSGDLSVYQEGKAVGWPDGILIKSNVSPSVYIISQGKKRSFSSAEIFTGLGYKWTNIKIIFQQELDQYETGSVVASLIHPDGTLLQFDDGPNIYLIVNGQKRLIPSAETFSAKGYDFKNVVLVSAKMKSNYPYGQIIT